MKKTFSSEDIVEAAFQVVRKQGRKNLSARAIAKELNSSTMPIYSSLNSMKDLEEKIGQKFTELLLEYSLTPWTGNFLVDIMVGYVRFAKDEKELFRLMFLDDSPSELANYQKQKPLVVQTLTARLKDEPGFKDLDEEHLRYITQNMEIIMHGLACLINYERLPDDSDEYIQHYLEEASAFFIQRKGADNGQVKQAEKKVSTPPVDSASHPVGDSASPSLAVAAGDTSWYSYTSSAQTMRTWAARLNSDKEIPPEFRTAFPKYKGPFPYTLFIPEDKYTLFLHRNKKILVIYEGQIILLEAGRNKIEKFASPMADVLYLERGKILLYSWLTIQTLAGAISIKFNTTGEELFEPVIAAIRQGMGALSADEAASADSKHEAAKFDYLNKVDYQYMNYGRSSLRPGDTVVGILHQPERCVQEYTLFNKTFFRRYATSHLSILTQQELILIKQNKKIKTAREALYGGVFTYIPRHRIQAISFRPDPEQTQSIMEITLPGSLQFSSEFSSDNKELPAFQQQCRDISK